MTGPRGDAPIEKLAIVGPAFFSYVDGIAAEFRARGIEVVTFDDRHSNRVSDKIRYRLGLYGASNSPAARHREQTLRAIEAWGCGDVLLANVEAIDRSFVSRLNELGIRTHLYMWDGIANKPGYRAYLDLVASKATFDPVDAEALGMRYIPLFAEPVFAEKSPAPADYEAEIGFCGTVHSSRTRILAQLATAPWAKSIRLKLMLYYHSRGLFYVKALAHRHAWGLAPAVSSTPFSKAQIAEMFSRVRFVLDTAHHGQSGLTARTFEVLLSGARLLTFNKAAARLLPDSLQPRIRIIDRIEEAGAIDYASCGRLPPLTGDERYFLSLGRFVDQLLAMMQPEPARASAPSVALSS